jgi:uncharacterized membrane protein HdeD (DUF308 family)
MCAMNGDAAMTAGYGDVREAWWVPLVMGIVAVIFGLLLLSHPGETAVWVTFLVGFWWLVSGVINIVALFFDRTMWGWKLFSGILGLLAGFLVLDRASSAPLLTAVGLGAIYVILLGIQGMIIGGIDLVKAFKGGGWGIGIIGVLSILFGLLLIFNPFAGALALPFVFGILALVLGGMAIFMSFRLRSA